MLNLNLLYIKTMSLFVVNNSVYLSGHIKKNIRKSSKTKLNFQPFFFVYYEGE